MIGGVGLVASESLHERHSCLSLVSLSPLGCSSVGCEKIGVRGLYCGVLVAWLQLGGYSGGQEGILESGRGRCF